MGRKGKKWWFPPLENKKKPGPNDVVTIDGDEDFDTVMGREVNANHALSNRLIKTISIGAIDAFTDLVPDGNDRYRLEPSPQLVAMYPGLTLEEMKASLEVKLEYGIDQEPVPPQVSEEQEEEAAMMDVAKPVKRVKRSMWGPDAVFNCNTCDKSFNNWPSLRCHRLTHVNNPDKYQCKICEKKFPNSVVLSHHRRIHVNNPEKYQCKICGKKCQNSKKLWNHRTTHINNPDKYQFQIYQKKCPNSKVLSDHRMTHVNNPEKYQCQACEKNFQIP